MATIRTLMSKIRKNEEGATALEYGLLAALIATVIIAGATALGTNMRTEFQNIADTIN